MQPIHIIDWRADFIQSLGHCLTGPDMAGSDTPDPLRTTILFPHNRPVRYLREYYATASHVDRPCFLPEMKAIETFASSLARDVALDAPRPAGRLDRADLVYDVVRELHGTGQGLLSLLPLERERFLPWGTRLASLMEELLRQNVRPGGLAHMQGEVVDFAAALLEQLDAIHAGYLDALRQRGWTTPGLDWLTVLDHMDEISEKLRGTRIVAAGFYALSGAEDALLKRLWRDGTLEVYWHSDPALATGGETHFATVEHALWLTAWKARPKVIHSTPDTPHVKSEGPNITFVEGFDLHSQLTALQRHLRECDDLSSTAVVLPETSAMAPVLHHLPDMDVNISMGYPLARTALYGLVETVLQLQENRGPDGGYFWRDLVELLRHPYLRMLPIETNEVTTRPLRRVFRAHEREVRQGEVFQDPMAWMPLYGEPPLEELPEPTEELRAEVLTCCVTNFQGLETLAGLAEALRKLAAMLLERGRQLWRTYLVDAEYLARLMTGVLPELNRASLANEPLSPPTLFALFRQLCEAERVSFEPEPLTGLQVMGMLETRLLRFRQVLLLDAVEDRLPGTAPHDPLLPDPLRHLLSLPDARERDNVSAYNFHRLIQGAERVVLSYQAGITPGLFDNKSVRSRFVEQLLWEREKQEKRIITPGDRPPLTGVNFPITAPPPGPATLPATDGLRAKLKDLLTAQGVSASKLNTWLDCPKQFALRYLTGLKPLEDVTSDPDPAELGEAVHQALHRFFKPHVGKRITPGELDPQPLLDDFKVEATGRAFFARLPLDEQQSLLEAGRVRLATYLQTAPETTIISLEQDVSAVLEVADLSLSVKGRLDRVDERDEGAMVLDYKTGNLHLPKKSFWDDNDLWDRIRAYPDTPDSDLMADLRGELRSVQLPLYLYLYAANAETLPHNAAFVELKVEGQEKALFDKKWTAAEREEAVGRMTPELIRCIVTDMLGAEHFIARPSRNCQWCDFAPLCGG